MTDMLFRDLNDEEVAEFQQWARDNYQPGKTPSVGWHPVVRAEWQRLEDEGWWTPDRVASEYPKGITVMFPDDTTMIAKIARIKDMDTKRFGPVRMAELMVPVHGVYLVIGEWSVKAIADALNAGKPLYI